MHVKGKKLHNSMNQVLHVTYIFEMRNYFWHAKITHDKKCDMQVSWIYVLHMHNSDSTTAA